MNKNIYLFEEAPVSRAVISLIVPTVISQLITVIYNMADTFFVGQLGDPNQVAAAAICMPIFILLTGFANLFGIGGSSLISRSLGKGDKEKARKTFSFCLYTSGAVAVAYGLIILFLKPVFLPFIGANEGTYLFSSQYALWAITIGGLPTVISACLAHLVRAEGYSKQAGFGIALGGILNIILDPIFISVLGLEIKGAAIATMISNVVAVLYFLILITKKKGDTIMVLNPKYYTVKMNIPREVFLVGLPSCLMNIMSVFSNVTLNRLMASYCNEAIAGIGIAKKIDMLCYGVANGMSQGALPLIGYNYASGNFKRMMSAVKTTFIMSITVAAASSVLLLVLANPIVKAFINDPLTVEYGRLFQRIICITGPCISVTLIIITIFQAVGQKLRPLILSLLRKGGLDVPLMILMNYLIGINGIAWAIPMADTLAMIISIITFIPFWKELKKNISEEKEYN